MNDTLFLAINASGHPNPWLVALASFLADDIIYGVPLLLAALWLWGKREWRSGLLAAFCAGELALFVNQIIALFWFHPRPMMVPIGHTLLKHAADSSFPSDHVTFLWAVGLSLALETRLRIAGLFLLFLSLVVAWARVFVGVHFPFDMVGAVSVATVCVVLLLPLRTLFTQLVTPKLAEPLYRFLFAKLIGRGWVRP
ncbi:undecaprenyl-diphosphatase [Hyphomicrobium denitrificans]|uniref:undecaprenyl-diphosphatase n=1 Tax=Hyphomicrobium denitrificans TaxID=53399 RepID=UPI00191C026D|nr:undecaprenyl-diphosphatase [Hyphomicrobium denitrificans]